MWSFVGEVMSSQLWLLPSVTAQCCRGWVRFMLDITIQVGKSATPLLLLLLLLESSQFNQAMAGTSFSEQFPQCCLTIHLCIKAGLINYHPGTRVLLIQFLLFVRYLQILSATKKKCTEAVHGPKRTDVTYLSIIFWELNKKKKHRWFTLTL